MSASSGSPSQEAVLSSVHSAVVYADAGAADWINWARLLPGLIERGALAVREFHPSEKLPRLGGGGNGGSIRKAVFLLAGRPDTRVAMETLAELVMDTGLSYVLVLTGACPEADACADVEEQLGQWLGHGATAQVRFVPLGHVTLVPGEAAASADAPPQPPPEFVVLGGAAPDVSPAALTRSLHSLLCEMSLREDVFCLGQAACRLGDCLAGYAPAKERRRLANHRRAALLLVDRALDLVGPLSYLSDSWLDALYRAGEPLLLTDVQVDLTAFTRSRCPGYLPVGSLSGCCLDSPLGRRLAGEAAGKSTKAAAAAAQRAVADAMTTERVAFDPSLLIAASSSADAGLGRLLDRLAAARPDLAFTGRHAAAVQLAVAVRQSASASASPVAEKLQQLMRLEKSLLGAAAGPPGELAGQLAALAEAAAGVAGPDELLALKVIGASLVPPAQLPPPPPPHRRHPDDGDDTDDDDDDDDNHGDLLARLSAARSAGQPRLRLCDCSVVPTYSPLIGQLASDVIVTSSSTGGKPAAGGAGLQYAHKSTGLSGLFGYLGVTSKPKPADSDLVLVCLIGGCTWAEHRVLRERMRQLQAGGGGGGCGKRIVLVTDRLLRGRDQLIRALRRGELF